MIVVRELYQRGFAKEFMIDLMHDDKCALEEKFLKSFTRIKFF